MVTLTINGREITVEDGTLILDAARLAGFEIPTFCYQADLLGIGSCRMCLVQIEGQRKLQPSCITPVIHDMKVITESPTIAEARAGVLEFFLSNHALDCPVCDKGGECELQDAVHRYGPRKGRFSESKHRFHDKDYILSPVIVKNSNRCIQCLKCVRVCAEVVGVGVLGSIGRGHEQEETSFFRSMLDCDQDGNCIEVCPVGCFMRLPYRYRARPWDLTGADSICPWCATGCRLVVEARDGQALRARARLGVGINSETLCARGRFGFDFINSSERITEPLIRKFGRLEPVSWPEAIDYIKDNLDGIRGERMGGVASPRLTNEELFLFQKLLRDVLSSPNIDSSTRWQETAVENFISATAMTGGGVSVFDCMEADTVIVAGTQLSEENPVVDYIVRRLSHTRPVNIIVCSPRAMKLDSSASVVVRHEAGAEGPLFEAVTRAIHEATPGALEGVAGIERIKGGTLDDFLSGAGIGRAEVEDIHSRLSRSASVSIMAGTDLLRNPGGSTGLALLRDALGAAGKRVTVLPVLDRCNQRGAWEMGVLPGLGPGYSSPGRKGHGLWGMLERASEGDLDALYVIGTDIIGSAHDETYARTALSGLKFLIVEDIFMTETARAAHCVLPGASFAEKEGTFTNQEGRVQAIKRLMRPPGRGKSDLEIIAMIGRAFSPSFIRGEKARFSDVFEEIRKEVPMYGEVDLRFVNRANKDNNLDNRKALVAPSGTTVALSPARFRPRAGTRRFRLVTGNHLFHSGRSSMRSPTLAGLLGRPVVEISEDDAEELGLRAGEKVVVRGENYEATVTLKTRSGTRRGVAFLPENFDEVPAARFFRPGGGPPEVDIERSS